jgi:two-component system, LytTR family, response regulator
MNIVIVDDEQAGRRAVRDSCAVYDDLNVIGEFADPAKALDFIREHRPDVLFLDIRMATMSGLELARQLDHRALPIIVFVTAFDEHALEAITLCALDYLLKPFDDERFEVTVERVRKRRREETSAQRETTLLALLDRFERGQLGGATQRQRIMAEAGGAWHMLDVERIELVEASRNYVKITVGRSTYYARSTLQHAERALASEPVVRISRSSLVNANHVREIHKTPRGDFIFVLGGGTTVTSSQTYRDKVRQYFDTLRLSHDA